MVEGGTVDEHPVAVHPPGRVPDDLAVDEHATLPAQEGDLAARAVTEVGEESVEADQVSHDGGDVRIRTGDGKAAGMTTAGRHHRVVGAGVAALLALAAVTIGWALRPERAAPPPGDLAAALGMKPNPAFLDLAALDRVETWLGRQLRWTVQMGGRRSPADLLGSVHGQLRADHATLPGLADRMGLVFTVPLAFGGTTASTPDGVAAIADALAATAAGAHDATFRRVAEALVAAGYPDAVIRLGHEPNGAWYPWSAVGGNAAAYVDAYRHVHGVFRSVSSRFRFDWCVARPNWSTVGVASYPGDDVVDVVSMDVYLRADHGPWSRALWDEAFAPVLADHRAFARARGKPVGYPEWGMDGLDEPGFVVAMDDWFRRVAAEGPGLAYQAWFNGGTMPAIDTLPRSGPVFRERFGG
jgi:hypothetical protein